MFIFLCLSISIIFRNHENTLIFNFELVFSNKILVDTFRVENSQYLLKLSRKLKKLEKTLRSELKVGILVLLTNFVD